MTSSEDSNVLPGSQPSELVSTIDLLNRFQGGDESAVGELVERSLPPLKRWARGRLPVWARSMSDTQDLVQDAIIRAMPHLKRFKARHPGALQAYLRQAIANRIRDEIRKVQARPLSKEAGSSLVDAAPTQLEQVIGRERLELYESALARLQPAEREAIIARIELQQSYEEVAIALGKPTAGAARIAVTRAVRSLIRAMQEH